MEPGAPAASRDDPPSNGRGHNGHPAESAEAITALKNRGQGEEFGSYGELDMAAVWLIDLAPDVTFPDAGGFYGWMLGEG